MGTTKTLIGLDVGERRIGVAQGDTSVRLAFPYGTLDVDGSELSKIQSLTKEVGASTIVVGYPRNQQGEATQQTTYVQNFIEKLRAVDGFDANVELQDESLTSVIAEQRLIAHKKPYTKADIDAQAAVIILQDFIGERYG